MISDIGRCNVVLFDTKLDNSAYFIKFQLLFVPIEFSVGDNVSSFSYCLLMLNFQLDIMCALHIGYSVMNSVLVTCCIQVCCLFAALFSNNYDCVNQSLLSN